MAGIGDEARYFFMTEPGAPRLYHERGFYYRVSGRFVLFSGLSIYLIKVVEKRPVQATMGDIFDILLMTSAVAPIMTMLSHAPAATKAIAPPIRGSRRGHDIIFAFTRRRRSSVLSRDI